jgi:RNA recognition motif-containing protein
MIWCQPAGQASIYRLLRENLFSAGSIRRNSGKNMKDKDGVRMNIYVGNLQYELAEEDLQQAFEAFGQVESAKIVRDRFSGESKRFGFVEMPAHAEAKSAITGLDGKELKGQRLTVRLAPAPKGAEVVEGEAVGRASETWCSHPAEP